MKKSISPMLATLIEKPLMTKSGSLKSNGWLSGVAEKAGDVHLISRNHKDFINSPVLSKS